MEATIHWRDGVSFTATSGSGHTCITDGPLEFGGHNAGARPMELLLMGLGACAAFDVVRIVTKSRQSFIDCRVYVKAERADQDPKVFTAIHLHFILIGTDVSAAVVKRAVELSAEKYCSASIMLQQGGVMITHDYTIQEEQL